MRRVILTSLLVCIIAMTTLPALPAPAEADVFGPISLVSDNATQQADYAHDPAISGDGRYVAFDGFFGGKTGVFRRDLTTGAVEEVAAGAANTPAGSAELPSINENGRYVSFTTTAALMPEDKNKAPDVYVRDMEPQPGEPEYRLASAITVGGQTQALTYEYAGEPGTEEEQREFEEQRYGSLASGRSALSANGQEAVFVTTAISNLANPAKTNTPALQVAVRYLATQETRLVSVAYNPITGRPAINPKTGLQQPVSEEEGGLTYGAVYSPGQPPPQFKPPVAYGLQTPLGASISADGSTIAWIGQDISRQAPFLSGEAPPAQYSEPLWRRIADGPGAPTRRITGGSDPANPACAASGETTLVGGTSPSDPCLGPFLTEAPGIWGGGTGNPVPQLSANGSTVAFLAGAPPIDGTFGGDVLNLNSDLYVVNMAAGLTRRQALRPLTRLASGNAQEPATTAPIVDLAISPDGSQVAFTTQRTVFPLGSPAYVSAPAATPSMAELFDVDLVDDTLTRVTQGFAGGASEAPHGTEVPGQDPYSSSDGALSPSFSDDGDTLAFSSTASNLVYGDGNTPRQPESTVFDGSDAFVVSRVLFGATPTPQLISSMPSDTPLSPAWRLDMTPLSRRDGRVLLEVEVPGAGILRASAWSSVRVRASRRAHAKRASAHARTTTATVAARAVATSNARASAGALIAVTLELAKRYSALATTPGGLSATVNLTFSAPGRSTLHQNVAVTFLRSERPSRRSRQRRTAAARPGLTHKGRG